jgi:hypothetical protein
VDASTLPYLFLPSSSNLYIEAGVRDTYNSPEKTRSQGVNVDFENLPAYSNLQFPGVAYVELPNVPLPFSNGARSYVYVPDSEHDSATFAACPYFVY